MGSLQFNLDEIFELAEQIERNGARFYRRAAEILVDEQAVRLLTDLAAMEDEHEQTFQSLRANLVKEEWREERAWETDEHALYLQAMGDQAVFDVRVDPLQRLTGVTSLQEVLTLAIGLEKASIDFYVGLQKLTRPQRGREEIDRILEEEIKHVVTLNRVRALLGEAKA